MARLGPRLIGILAPCLIIMLAACGNGPQATSAAPPRADDPIVFPDAASHIEIDLAVDLAALEEALEKEIPRQLWAIDQPGSTCIASKKINLELFRVKSPRITCHIIGKVTRGRLQLAGRGRDLIVTMPVTGQVAARDVAGILKGETGTGAATVSLALQLDVAPDWKLAGTSRLDYRWTREPGIDFLGRRITFTSQADDKLAAVRKQVQAIIARELSRVDLRAAAQQGWNKAHGVFVLNRVNPAVWGRLTPQQFLYGGYQVQGRELTLRLGLDGRLETFVGKQPDAPAPAALPPLARRPAATAPSVLHVPVMADYAVLEPVIAKALAKRAKRPFVIADFGSVTAEFGQVTVYGTPPGRIAVGAKFKASSDLPMVKAAKGTIWLAARPITLPGSREVSFTDVTISGDTSLVSQPLLLALANAPEFKATIAEALRQNFEEDFAKLRSKIDRALARRQSGGLDYAIRIDTIETGAITAHGAGLYLPVDITARGQARLGKIK